MKGKTESHDEGNKNTDRRTGAENKRQTKRQKLSERDAHGER